MQPFLKWPGGKRWLAAQNGNLIPENYNHYFEPFLGSGAVFFSILPDHSTISDINRELINLYTVMRDQPQQLQDIMLQHQARHSNEYYYLIRSENPTNDVERAGRMLYLNRTCFNGMYRVNRQGLFNVPIGTKTNCIYDIDQFVEYSDALRNAEIISCDFADVIGRANDGDFIFVDPPYAKSNGSSFIKYNQALFTWDDQTRLHTALNQARQRGALIVLTNANCQEIQELYVNSGYTAHTVCRHSTISGQVENRGIIEELVLTSF